jgi:drug/metabolite transporter (DMT)-like permease
MAAFLFEKLTKPASQHVGVGLGILAVMIWGGYLAYTRAGITQGISAQEMTFLRFLVAALLMLPWAWRHLALIKNHLTLSKALVLTFTAGPLFILLGAGGYQYAPLAHGAAIQPATITLTGILLGTWWLREKLNPKQITGIVMLVIGTSIVALYGPGQTVHFNLHTLQGELMFVGAGMLWGLFSYFCKRWLVPPLVATATVAIGSAMVYVPIYLWFNGFTKLLVIPTATLLTQAMVQGVLSGVIAVLAYSKVVQIMGVSKASMFPALVPSVALLLGIPVVGETPTTLQWCGVMVSLIGFVMINKIQLSRAVLSKTPQSMPLIDGQIVKSL